MVATAASPILSHPSSRSHLELDDAIGELLQVPQDELPNKGQPMDAALPCAMVLPALPSPCRRGQI